MVVLENWALMAMLMGRGVMLRSRDLSTNNVLWGGPHHRVLLLGIRFDSWYPGWCAVRPQCRLETVWDKGSKELVVAESDSSTAINLHHVLLMSLAFHYHTSSIPLLGMRTVLILD